jgi:hypothetical protein
MPEFQAEAAKKFATNLAEKMISSSSKNLKRLKVEFAYTGIEDRGQSYLLGREVNLKVLENKEFDVFSSSGWNFPGW